MLKKFYICVIFVMQIIMAECQQLYGYRTPNCTGPPSFDMYIDSDTCYTIDTFNLGSFSYVNGVNDDIVMVVFFGIGCNNTTTPYMILTQPECIPVDFYLVRYLDMSFALIKATAILEMIDLRVAAMGNTEIIASNCLCNKF